MAKRKIDDKSASKDKMDLEGDDSGSDDGEDGDILNVDFEWFDPQPAIDFHGLRTLLRQLLDIDNMLFDLSALTDMILAQPLLGSTVKCDGNESDPFAFLSVLNMHQHRDTPVIAQLRTYLAARAVASGDAAINSHLKSLLAADSTAQIGLILTERLINMPHQIVAPMYNMLLEEIQWANAEKEPYEFSHYLIVSKTYVEVKSKLDDDGEEPSRPQKKKKKDGGSVAAETFYFHPEDEVLQRNAVASCGFDYALTGDEGASDSKRAFQELGVKPQGSLILIEEEKFAAAVKAVEEYLGGEA